MLGSRDRGEKGMEAMIKMIGYCGLICTDCEAFLATQSNDWAALERMAAKAREEYGMPEATAEAVLCDGCLTASGRQCGYCEQCQVRACALERGMANCAHCRDYACEKLESFFGLAPAARTMLDEIRAGVVA
jgi:hypothetical protein